MNTDAAATNANVDAPAIASTAITTTGAIATGEADPNLR